MDAVPATVDVVVDLSPLPETLQDGRDHTHMLGLRRADEAIVGDIQVRPGRLEPLGHPVGQLDGLYALLCGGLLHLLTVLVGARKEEHVGPRLAVITGQEVGEYRRVGVPQVGLA